jgi:hypothetical protein
VVELYRHGVDVEHARDPLLALNTAKVGPGMAARVIDQPDLQVWYEIINPVRSTTTDGAPVADDYSNVKLIVPDGHRAAEDLAALTGVGPPVDTPRLHPQRAGLAALAWDARRLRVPNKFGHLG